MRLGHTLEVYFVVFDVQLLSVGIVIFLESVCVEKATQALCATQVCVTYS